MEKYVCQYCSSIRPHHRSWHNHERCCPSNSNRYIPIGRRDKGSRGPNQYIKARQLGLLIPEGPGKGKTGPLSSSYGRKHSEESKQKISLARSLNNKGGRSKWYEVNGIKVQGTWERDIATILTEKSIQWIKPTTANHSFRYEMNGKIRTYTPDFYLNEQNLYLEVKGYWWGNDKEKMQRVLEQNPNTKIVVIEKGEYERILNGELVW